VGSRRLTHSGQKFGLQWVLAGRTAADSWLAGIVAGALLLSTVTAAIAAGPGHHAARRHATAPLSSTAHLPWPTAVAGQLIYCCRSVS